MDICSLDGAKRLQNILVYESVFGTEFRYLEEEYN